MCELFGLCASEKVRVNRYLKTLASHGIKHRHGWGLAVFDGPFVNLEKEPEEAWKSAYLMARLRPPFFAENMIGHIRLASEGKGQMLYQNCHPFVKRDRSGRAWTLAHNGTIFRTEQIDVYAGLQEGKTDSEGILCHILHEANAYLESQGDAFNPERRFEMMERIVLDLAPENKLNLLVYDGEMMYVHTNMADTLYVLQTDRAAMFATVPLTKEEWQKVPQRQLLAYKDGRQVFCGRQHPYEYIKK